MSDVHPAERAQLLVAAGDMAGARRLVQAHLAQHPTDAPALIVLATVAQADGQPAEAERALAAATTDPTHRPMAAAMLGELLDADSGRNDEGLRWVAEAVRLEPQDWQYRGVYAARLRDAGDLPSSWTQSQEMLRLAPTDQLERARALTRYAAVLVVVPAWHPQALAAVREAVALNPMDQAPRQLLAILLTQRGRGVEAIAVARQVLAEQPNAPVLPLLMRLAHWRLARRLLGVSALVSFAVAMLTMAVLLGTLGVTTASRIGGALDLVLVGGFWALQLRVLADPSTRRAFWREARRRPSTWVYLAFSAVLMLGWIAAIAGVPPFAIAGAPFVFSALFVAHGYAALRLRTNLD